jgi:heme/copper-type cytochrome/quinol oxidase subunit 2
MIFIGVLLGLAIMAAISYMAIDKKSSFAVRIACLIALGIMIITVVICVIYASSGPVVQIDWSEYKVGDPVEVKKESHNSVVVIITLVFLIILFAVIVYLSMKEQRKHASPKPKIEDMPPMPPPSDDFEL